MSATHIRHFLHKYDDPVYAILTNSLAFYAEQVVQEEDHEVDLESAKSLKILKNLV